VTTVGVGIIGYGFIGKVHAYAYRTIPFHYDPPPLAVRLIGVATSRAETAEAARAHGGFDVGTADWRELVARPDIQVIDICSPNTLHADQLAAAMTAGKHIYCEKPLTATVAEARSIARAARTWKGIGQMTFHNRFFSAPQRARQLIDAGFLGTPLGMRGVYLHAGSVDPSAPLKWKLRGKDGGGVLRDLGSHLLDLADWLAGPIVAVRADTRIAYPTRPDGRGGTAAVDAEDQAVLTVRLASGALGTLEVSKIATGAEDDLRLEIHGSRGALRFNLMEPDFLEAYSLEQPDMPLGGTRGWNRIAAGQRYPAPAAFPSPRATSGWLRGHVHCMWHFLDTIARGAAPDPSLLRGVAVQEMMDCAEKSAGTGRWVDVPPG
jgi:predicted dehydrogenase